MPRRSRKSSLSTVLAGEVQGDVGGPTLVVFGDKGLECSLLDLELLVGARREEGRLGIRLEIRPREAVTLVGLREQIEGLLPGVATDRLPPGK